MTIRFDASLARAVREHGQRAYPDEGAGLLLGALRPDDERRVTRLLPLENQWDAEGRGRRYRLDPRDLMRAEDEADRDGLTVLGVFHSHPDHPAEPSAFDLAQALPFYTYLITSIEAGVAGATRAWRLAQDRGRFDEETVHGFDRLEKIR